MCFLLHLKGSDCLNHNNVVIKISKVLLPEVTVLQTSLLHAYCGFLVRAAWRFLTNFVARPKEQFKRPSLKTKSYLCWNVINKFTRSEYRHALLLPNLSPTCYLLAIFLADTGGGIWWRPVRSASEILLWNNIFTSIREALKGYGSAYTF